MLLEELLPLPLLDDEELAGGAVKLVDQVVAAELAGTDADASENLTGQIVVVIDVKRVASPFPDRAWLACSCGDHDCSWWPIIPMALFSGCLLCIGDEILNKLHT